MIFSLSNTPSKKFDFTLPKIDIFCFFTTVNSIQLPVECWDLAVATSLRMKREVFILEQPIEHLPEFNRTQRWQLGPHYIWLAPRSLSVYFEAPHLISISFDSMRKYLMSYKYLK